jgi:hypothetical protein
VASSSTNGYPDSCKLKQPSTHTLDNQTEDSRYWGIQNGPTLANIHLAQGHLDEQIGVEGELTEAEKEAAIIDVTSFELEIMAFKKELLVLKKQKTRLSQQNTAAKVEVMRVGKKETVKYSKAIWQIVRKNYCQRLERKAAQLAQWRYAWEQMPEVNGLVETCF